MVDPTAYSYSQLFSCLYDQREPVGTLGRGTHHSVFRSVTSLDRDLMPLDRPKLHDFAVIWDEDHDERVIPVVEGLLMQGLLAPVLFVGERKGTLNVIVDDALFADTSANAEEYIKAVDEVCQANSGGDYWPTEVVSLKRTPLGLDGPELGGIVNDQDVRVLTYLRAIDVLWKLGVKEHRRVAAAPVLPPIPAQLPYQSA
jgi:hypothetical protein